MYFLEHTLQLRLCSLRIKILVKNEEGDTKDFPINQMRYLHSLTYESYKHIKTVLNDSSSKNLKFKNLGFFIMILFSEIELELVKIKKL